MAVLESHDGYYLWKYVPSAVAAGIFALLFCIATIAHFWKMITTKTKFCTAFSIGCFQFIGYCTRASAHNRTGKLMPFIIQNVFILVSPALFAASIYMTLGRIIRAVKGEKLSIIRPSRLTKTFVTGDILSFLIQGGSAGLMINSTHAKIGEAMVVTGLFMQSVMFALFALTAILFQTRISKSPTTASYDPEIPWRQSLYMLYAVSALIMARSIFRIVEYLMGYNGYALGHEWTLYVFDSLLMIVTTAIFWWWYPNEIRDAVEKGGEVELVHQVPYGKV